jgi:hypothetical protein
MSQEITSSSTPSGNLSEHSNTSAADGAADATSEQTADATAASRSASTIEFSSPGLTPLRRYGTAAMLFVLGLFVVGIVLYEGHSGIVAAVLGALLIAGFIWYLRMIRPAPFTLRLLPEGLERKEQGAADPLLIPWNQFARVKEEQFSNGKIIGVMVFARSKHSVYRALVLYRDDLPRFDDFRKALKAATLPETPWQLETVHE